MLFFFGLALFFPNSRYLLWFSLACGCIALRGLLTGDKAIMLLLPDLDWYMSIRMEYITTVGFVLFSVLYLSRLFSGALNKWSVGGFAAFCVSSLLFICAAPPIVFTRFLFPQTVICAAFAVYMLAEAVIAVLRKKIVSPLSAQEQMLLAIGLGVFALLSVRGVYAHSMSRVLLGLDYPQVGIMVFLFINILTLALNFSRTERMLEEAHASEREVKETNKMLERLDRLRLDFLANISHEIKTPLTVAGGFAQYALSQIEKGTVGEDTKQNLMLISKEASRLSKLAEGLLNVSADMAWDRRVMPIQTVIERAADTCRPILAKNNNQLDVQIDDGLPPVRVNGDMIHQVILNLAINANSHTRDGTVVLSGEAGDGAVAVAVSDNGKGIGPGLLPQVFKRRVSGRGGTGLGLAICKEIIELHGGSIAVESAPGAGTRVTFTLPAEGAEGAKGGAADEANNTVD
jgi:signal transduction histidine kinase